MNAVQQDALRELARILVRAQLSPLDRNRVSDLLVDAGLDEVTQEDVELVARAGKASEDDEDSRYWIDDNPVKAPFRVETRGIVDEEAGGVVAYVCTEELAQILIRALEKEGT